MLICASGLPTAVQATAVDDKKRSWNGRCSRRLQADGPRSVVGAQRGLWRAFSCDDSDHPEQEHDDPSADEAERHDTSISRAARREGDAVHVMGASCSLAKRCRDAHHRRFTSSATIVRVASIRSSATYALTCNGATLGWMHETPHGFACCPCRWTRRARRARRTYGFRTSTVVIIPASACSST